MIDIPYIEPFSSETQTTSAKEGFVFGRDGLLVCPSIRYKITYKVMNEFA